jgi:hypothetical protein
VTQLVLALALVAAPLAEEGAQSPSAIGVVKGEPAPFTGVLLSPERAGEVAIVEARALELERAAVDCRAEAAAGADVTGLVVLSLVVGAAFGVAAGAAASMFMR